MILLARRIVLEKSSGLPLDDDGMIPRRFG
jgi:hypothetical protein